MSENPCGILRVGFECKNPALGAYEPGADQSYKTNVTTNVIENITRSQMGFEALQ